MGWIYNPHVTKTANTVCLLFRERETLLRAREQSSLFIDVYFEYSIFTINNFFERRRKYVKRTDQKLFSLTSAVDVKITLDDLTQRSRRVRSFYGGDRSPDDDVMHSAVLVYTISTHRHL